MDLKLKSDLLCEYDSSLRPPAPHTPIVLKYLLRNIDHVKLSNTFRFNSLFLLFQNDYDTITIQSIIRQRWNDSRLEWNPEKYEGLKGIYVQPDMIWKPKLFLNDSHYHYGLGSCHETNCLIKYNGDVICQFPCHQNAICRGDFSDWPFDIQSCDVVFRTFETQEKVSFDSEEISGSVIGDYNKQWKLISAVALMNRTDGTNVKFTFVIKRFAEAIYRHVYIPGYVLIALTLSVLWMKEGTFMRAVLCGASIFLHFHLMDRVWWQ